MVAGKGRAAAIWWRNSSGRPTPATSPSATPAPASTATCNRLARKISPPSAPSVRRVARVEIRASTQARTAEATPMPPTAMPERPTRIRKAPT